MAESSITGGDAQIVPPGHDIDSLGPSDSSDSGSDVQGQRRRGGADAFTEGAVPVPGSSDTDAAGTGERSSATDGVFEDDQDIRPDRVSDADGVPLSDDTEPLLDSLSTEDGDDESDDPTT